MISYGWFKKRLEFDVLTNSGRFHLNINGALCLDVPDIVARTCERVNRDLICDIFYSIRLKNSEEENFILDNTPFNRSNKAGKKAKELGINLVYFPYYSPNLNPIERLWKFFPMLVMISFGILKNTKINLVLCWLINLHS